MRVDNEKLPSNSKTRSKSRNRIVSKTQRSSPPHRADSRASGRSERSKSCVTLALPRQSVDRRPVTTDKFVVTPRVLDADKDILFDVDVSLVDVDETGVNCVPVDFETKCNERSRTSFRQYLIKGSGSTFFLENL